MPKRINIVGQRYGKLVVLEELPSKKTPSGQTRAQVLVRCDCGREAQMTSANLRFGNTKSCGCSTYDNHFKEDYHVYMTYVYNDVKAAAEARGREFSLTRERIQELIEGNCIYCNQPPTPRTIKRGRNITFPYNSIDRVDNGKGYVEGNVASCCSQCNRAKASFTLQQFVSWLSRFQQWEQCPELQARLRATPDSEK